MRAWKGERRTIRGRRGDPGSSVPEIPMLLTAMAEKTGGKRQLSGRILWVLSAVADCQLQESVSSGSSTVLSTASSLPFAVELVSPVVSISSLSFTVESVGAILTDSDLRVFGRISSDGVYVQV